ncbi:MAG TPA: sugar-binding protein [Pirellulales bacterium]|nr:sugar-binding protein [Pirellulales bacterium]
MCRGTRLSVLFIAALAAGCSDSAPKSPAQPSVAFVSNNPFEFWAIARKGTEKAATELGIKVEFRMPAHGSATEQRQIVEDLLVQGVQGIAVSPIDPKNQAEFFDEVAERVPLLTQDSDLPTGSKRLCFLGTDNYEAGKAAGQLVKEALPDGGRVAIYVGSMDAQNAIDRRQGVLDELADAKQAEGPTLGKYTLIGTFTDDASQENCKRKVEDTLVTHAKDDPESLCLVGLWAYNPPAMLAAVQDQGLAKKVKIVGFDENEETLQGIKYGNIQGTVVQQPFEFGYQAVRMLASLAKGDKSVVPDDGIRHIDYKVIKGDNVDAFHDELRALKGTDVR